MTEIIKSSDIVDYSGKADSVTSVSTGNHINPNPLPPSAIKNIPAALAPTTDTPHTTHSGAFPAKVVGPPLADKTVVVQGKPLVAPTSAVAGVMLPSPKTIVTSEPATVQPVKSLQDLIHERFVTVRDLRATGSNFPFRGLCMKCGWQTHQFSESDAAQLVFLHAQSHWRDIPLALYAPPISDGEAAKLKAKSEAA